MVIGLVGSVGFEDEDAFRAVAVLTEGEMQLGQVGAHLLPLIVMFAPQESSREVTQTLGIPVDALVTQAVVQVTADAPGATNVGGIATVRAAAGDPALSSNELVVDFATLRTVSSVRVPSQAGDVISVRPWVGTRFDTSAGATFEGAPSTWVDFTEMQTERLLITVRDAITPALLYDDGVVTTTTPPADLELLVGDERVWFRAGPAPADFAEDVDVTSALQAAVDAAGTPDGDGNLHVTMTLRARVPGTLGLSLPGNVHFLRTLKIDFPGPTTTLRFSEEGTRSVTLPLPGGSAAWTIHRVVTTVAAEDPGPGRVLPPVGPERSRDAELLLDADRRLVARLPAVPLSHMEAVSGVRVLLQPDVGGIEIGGGLLGGTLDDPGEPLPDATFTPVSLPAAAAAAWVTLALARPIELPVDQTAWTALSVTRGRAMLALAQANAVPAGEVTSLRRIAPNGIAHPLSTAVLHRSDRDSAAIPLRTDALALRVCGEASEDDPITLTEVDLAGGPTVRAPAGPGAISISPQPAGTRPSLELLVTTTAATTVTVGPVVVAYTEPGGQS